jgi:hypothetical protein
MTGFSPDPIRKVKKACNRKNIPLTEDVTGFLLGHYLENTGSDVAFQVGKIGTELGYSPDIDVLEMHGKKAIGYEIKGVQGNNEINKNQLYTGLGQAQLLLAPPLTFSDSNGNNAQVLMLRKSYLVYPQGDISASDEWIDKFINRIKDIPSVGLIAINPQGEPTTKVEAEPNIPSHCDSLSGLAREQCLKLDGGRLNKVLSENNTGKSIKNPDRSLEVLAEKIAEQHDIDLISFT